MLLFLDPGWVKIRIPGSGINIPDPQHWYNLRARYTVPVVVTTFEEESEVKQKDS
jgi:hypothetical protein